MFVGKTRSLPLSRAPENIRLGWKSLLQKFVTYDRNFFITLAPVRSSLSMYQLKRLGVAKRRSVGSGHWLKDEAIPAAGSQCYQTFFPLRRWRVS
jgi:hypothetical protein